MTISMYIAIFFGAGSNYTFDDYPLYFIPFSFFTYIFSSNDVYLFMTEATNADMFYLTEDVFKT